MTAAELAKRGSCHLFRHSMATAMLENGADVRYVQEMLGHARLTSTEVYTRVSVAKLREIHSATHPGLRPRPEGPELDQGERDGEAVRQASVERDGEDLEDAEDPGGRCRIEV